MFKVVSVHYSEALSCYSTVQGSGGSGTSLACTGTSAACFVKINKYMDSLSSLN